MKAAAWVLAIAASFPSTARAGAILDDASAAFAKVDDYTATIVVHETDGRRIEDRTYAYAFKKPSDAKIDIVAGPGKGGGIVWRGGDKVKGHRGGILSGIRLTLDLHDPQVLSLRGDSIDTSTIAAMLERFRQIKGDVTESAGPPLEGAATDVVTLKVADPAADKGVTREVLYLSKATHLPVRRDRFAGDALVKSETFTALRTNVGLKADDFPF